MRKADAATPGEWARGQLMVVGLSYYTTSLEKREQLASISEQRGTAQKPMPGVLLATCNRIELYSWVTGRRGDQLPCSPGPWPKPRGYLSRRSNPTCSPNRARRRCGISSVSSAVWTPL